MTLRYPDARAHTWRTMTLAGEAFRRRFLPHVAPRGFHTVRDSGWWRPQAAPVRVRLQQQRTAAAPSPRLHDPKPDVTRAPAPCGAHGGIGHLVRTRRRLRTHTATCDLTHTLHRPVPAVQFNGALASASRRKTSELLDMLVDIVGVPG